jgi:hypothetical protein
VEANQSINNQSMEAASSSSSGASDDGVRLQRAVERLQALVVRLTCLMVD